MSEKNSRQRLLKGKILFFLFLLVSICTSESRSQTGEKNAESLAKDAVTAESASIAETVQKPGEKKTDEKKSDEKKENIKVVFDENAVGIMIVESNGQKFRVDSIKKKVEPIIENKVENAAENNQPKDAATSQEVSKDKTQTDEKEEGLYDFEPGFEPYGYNLVNVPTPRSVPKGTWNLTFSHRFTQPIRPFSASGKTLLGFDSFSVSSFGVSYGITDKFYVKASRSPLCQRALCRTIEVGLGYQFLEINKKSPVAVSAYASVEGNGNFTEEYTYNLQTMLATRLGKRVYLFFSPAIHLNSNGQRRFNPRPNDYFPPATLANSFKLPAHTASFGFGTSILITPSLSAFFEFTPRIGFKLGRIQPILDANFNVTGFKNESQPAIGFGLQKNIGKHSFALTFSNTQTTTTSRYNSSNLLLKPQDLVIGFNLFRRW